MGWNDYMRCPVCHLRFDGEEIGCRCNDTPTPPTPAEVKAEKKRLDKLVKKLNKIPNTIPADER